MFDAYFPKMNWGGTEEWSCMVANAIAGLDVQTYMICGMNDKFDRLQVTVYILRQKMR